MTEIVPLGRRSTQPWDVTDGYTMQSITMKANDIVWDVGNEGTILTFDPPFHLETGTYAIASVVVGNEHRKYDALFATTPKSATGSGLDPKIYILVPQNDQNIVLSMRENGVAFENVEKEENPNSLAKLKVGR